MTTLRTPGQVYLSDSWPRWVAEEAWLMGSVTWLVRFGVGLAAGIGIAYVDNYAFRGEVSPIVVVVMLLALTSAAAGIWGRRGWITATAAWICVPLAHLVKHVVGLPDTLHPNTYGSILMLAGFTFVVAALGTGAGMLVHRSAVRAESGTSGRGPSVGR